MKRIVTLVAAAALIMGLAATASAELAFKAAGSWRVHANVLDNFGNFDDDTAEQTFTVKQRMRTQFRFVYNENVMGELATEYGDVTWGSGPGRFQASDAADAAFEIRRAFIQFRWPDTDVLFTVGQQDVSLPSSGAFSNIVLAGEDGSAIAVTSPITDMLGLTVAYARLDNNVGTTAAPVVAHNTFDAYVAALPVALDGMTLTPWFTYAQLGSNSDSAVTGQTEDGNAWWAGLAFNMDMLDPIVIYADFNYGSTSDELGDASGWLLDAMVEYKALDFAILQLFGAYSSGSDDAAGEDSMFAVYSDWGIGGSMINGSAFSGTDFGAANPGFWLAGVAARDITFIEKLSHDVIFLYAKGTGDAAARNAFLEDVNLTSDDSYWEVDFNTRYQIYESLAAIVELGYASPDFDNAATPDDAAMKAAFGFQYSF